MALGARTRTVVAGMVPGSMRTAAAGLAVGAIASLLITRLLRGLLFELSPLDPTTYAAAAAPLLRPSPLAPWLPARRAPLADPMAALQGGGELLVFATFNSLFA